MQLKAEKKMVSTNLEESLVAWEYKKATQCQNCTLIEEGNTKPLFFSAL